MNKNTQIELIGLIAILIFLWLILYFIPELFVTLFNTNLGNIILGLIVILVISYNIKYGIGLLIILVILYRFSLFSKKEGFSWTPESSRNFLLIQDTINPNNVFDINMIQKNQASQEELNYFKKYGIWPWSQKTQDLYIQAINSNPYISVSPKAALLETQRIYNETAILMILSYQTKEGQFLINGVQIPSSSPEEELPSGFGDFAYKSGLKPNLTKDVIRCNMDNSNMERTHYTGREHIFESQTSTTTKIDYRDLDNIIPGFSFINGPCNPCVAIKEKPDYSCPFKLELKDKNKNISSLWKTLWGLD